MVVIEYKSEMVIKSRSEVWFHFYNKSKEYENKGVVLKFLLTVIC